MNHNHPYSNSNPYQQQHYDSYNSDEPPSSSFFASQHEQSNSGGGSGGYRYAAYEDDYLYDDSNNLQHEAVVDDGDIHRNMGLPPESGHVNAYGENRNAYNGACHLNFLVFNWIYYLISMLEIMYFVVFLKPFKMPT